MANEQLAEGKKYLEQQDSGRIYCWLEAMEPREDMRPFIYKKGEKNFVPKETQSQKLKPSFS